MTVAELGRRFRSGELSPVEVTKQAVAQAERLQPRLNAFITLLAESALVQARASEERFTRHTPLGPLDGIPVGVKDLIHLEAVRTTAGSKIMASCLAAQDAEVIRRLKAGGTVMLGKTNLHEFAYGATGDVSHFGPVHNPWQLDHITGGSSSGSGAAVAAGICPVALGSDTGGSIRIPASMCGVVGLKPTYGRVSNEGVVPLAWSLDHVGPLTATVEDAGLSLQAMSDFRLPALEPAGSIFRVSVCRNFFFEHLDAEVRELVESALPLAGQLREVHIPHADLFPDVATVVISSESMTFHRKWLRERPEDYDQSVRFRLEGAQETKAVDYIEAMRVRALLRDEMMVALREVDVLATPTLPIAAPPFSQSDVELEDGKASRLTVITRNTAAFNATGYPAISIPCGFTRAGLPVGLQLAARPWDEALLLQVAHRFERQTQDRRRVLSL